MRSELPVIRRAVRVLHMVHELHKRGYQRLRIVPGMSPSGAHWRVAITPIANILRSHGALSRSYHENAAHYSSADGNNYFRWEDCRTATARDLADKFAHRFEEIVLAGRGQDWAYAGWYLTMLGFAEQEALPISYADWSGDPPRNRMWTTIADILLPAPPPGEADDLSPDE